MIDTAEAPNRHNELLRAAQRIADLERELREMTADRNKQQSRALMAEAQVRQLEQQLTSPAREIKTLYAHVDLAADREKLDADMAKLVSAGWEKFDSGVIPGDKPMRFVTFSRVKPIAPVEPEKHAGAAEQPVAAEAPQPAPAPQPVPDPLESLPVQGTTRKTVTAISAVMPVGAEPSAEDQPGEPVEPSPAARPDRDAARADQITSAAQKAYEDKLAASPLPAYKPIPSYKPVQENPVP